MNKTRSFDNIWPTLGEAVYIDEDATVIGKVTLGKDVSVWPGAILRGDMEPITIGEGSNVQDNAVLHTTHGSDFFKACPLNIGQFVVIGHSAVLHGCTLGDNILVGIGAIINDRVVVENLVMIGAGTVVPPGKVLASGYLYVGNPVRQLRALTDKEKNFLKYSPQRYIKLKDQYLQSLS